MEAAYTVHKVPMNKIFSDADFNCRGRIVPIDVIDLARSIANHGLQSPIVVQPWKHPTNPEIDYRIISGHRRHAAHIINEAETIDCIIKKDVSELNARKLNLEENLKRKDLTILQEAQAIKHFRDAGWPEEMIAQEIGMSRGWVQVRMMLLNMPEDIQIEAAAGYFTQEQIRQLYAIKDTDKRYEAVRKIKDAKMTGEKVVLKVAAKKPKDYLAKKPRGRDEIFDFMEKIIDTCGGFFGTRLLSWAAGEISDYEIERDLKEYCEEQGITYEIPREILSAMQV